MEGAVDEVDELCVEADAAALEEVEEVGAGAFGDFPYGAGLDGDVAGVLDVFEHGYGVAGEFEDHGELGEGAVELPGGFHDGGHIGDAPEALGLPDVGEDDEGDEAVGVGPAFEEDVVQPDVEGVGGPDFYDGGVGAVGAGGGGMDSLNSQTKCNTWLRCCHGKKLQTSQY